MAANTESTDLDVDVRPFRIAISDDDLGDLKVRLAHTRWPDPMPGQGWSRGVPQDYLSGLVDYWANDFDWRSQEERLNRHPQFTTVIEDQTVHFLHVRSDEADATPLMLIHGWPGSFVEFLDLIEPLTNPAADGAAGAPAFHLVIPSIPGHGFSNPLAGEGWTHQRIARTFTTLMSRLGYERYGVQGGDAGSAIAPDMGRIDPDHVTGVHVNALVQIPTPVQIATGLVTMSREERVRLSRFKDFLKERMGYAQIQGTRPKTLAYGLTDSPVGQLAWIVEKFKDWTDPAARLPEDAIGRDRILTDVSLYWFTRTAGSAANLYWETMHDEEGARRKHKNPAPTGVAVSMTQDVTIRRWAEKENNIVHWTELEHGGHFPALEQPELLVKDLRDFFGGLNGGPRA